VSEQDSVKLEGPGPRFSWRRWAGPLLLLAPGVFLEAASVAALLLSHEPLRRLPLLAASHGVACLLVALCARSWIPAALRGTPWRALSLLLCLCLFLPGIGMAGVLLLLLPALHRAGKEEELPWGPTEFPELPTAPFKVSAQPIYIAVGLVGVLRHSDDPALRLKAVMASRQMPDRLAIPILDIALKDQVDDVRLLAYSMLDGKERVIFERIKALDLKLGELGGGAERERGFIHLRLAQEYWELAYLGLAHGKVLLHVLSQAEEHLQAALAVDPHDPGALLLLGRVHLKRGDAEDAAACFRKARDSGMPGEVVAPYLAEVAFIARDFQAVRRHLGQLSTSAATKSPMAEVVQFWDVTSGA